MTPESPSADDGGKLPVNQIEEILHTDGKVTNGILSLPISQDQKDLHVTGQGGIPFKPAWQVNDEFSFQSLGDGKAMMTGELSLLSREANPAIDQILKHGLMFQAFHQYFFDLSPQLFHMHFRGVGNPLDLARAGRSRPIPRWQASSSSFFRRTVGYYCKRSSRSRYCVSIRRSACSAAQMATTTGLSSKTLRHRAAG